MLLIPALLGEDLWQALLASCYYIVGIIVGIKAFSAFN
jgi:predicted small integral membrane protein